MPGKKKTRVESEFERKHGDRTLILMAGKHSFVAQKDFPAIMSIFDKIKATQDLVPKTLLGYYLRHKPAVLKKYFTQDIKKAAHRYWLIEAFRIIKSVECIVKGVRNAQPVKYYIYLKSAEKPPCYEPITHVLSDEDRTKQMLDRAWADLKAWQQRYNNLVSFADWFRKAHIKITKIIIAVQKPKPGSYVEGPEPPEEPQDETEDEIE
jgi:hypothetical protein